MTAEQAKVDAKGFSYREMARWWPMVDTLVGGTQAMRDARTKYTPKHQKESDNKYGERLAESWLFGAYSNTLTELTWAPFQTPIQIAGEELLPPWIGALIQDADLKGRSLTAFAQSVEQEAVHRGLSHILPEMPPRRGSMTIAQAETSGVRPYLVHVSPVDLFGFQKERTAAGIERVKSFRYHEECVESDGPYGEKKVDKIRVYNLQWPDQVDEARIDRDAMGVGTELMFEDAEARHAAIGIRGTVEHWRKEESQEAATKAVDEEYQLEDVTPYTFVGMPLVTLYTHRTGFWMGKPALQELAEKNVEHWQQSSDQSNLVKFARVPINVRTGCSQEDIDNGFVVTSDGGWDTKDDKAKMYVVEHSGAAIGAGRTAIMDVEEQMEVLRLRARMKQGGDPKATVASIGEARGQSQVETWALGTAAAIRESLKHLLRFEEGQHEAELPEEVTVKVTAKNLALDPRAEKRVENLLKMRAAGELDRRTFLEEARRHGAFTEDAKIDVIVERIEEEQAETEQRGVSAFLQGGREPEPLRAVGGSE